MSSISLSNFNSVESYATLDNFNSSFGNQLRDRTNSDRYSRYVIEHFDQEKLYFAGDADYFCSDGEETHLVGKLEDEQREAGFRVVRKHRCKKVKELLRGKSFACFRKRY